MNISQLPRDAMLLVFGRLAPHDLARASCVCRDWNPLAQDASLWESHYAAIDSVRRLPPLMRSSIDFKTEIARCRRGVEADRRLSFARPVMGLGSEQCYAYNQLIGWGRDAANQRSNAVTGYSLPRQDDAVVTRYDLVRIDDVAHGHPVAALSPPGGFLDVNLSPDGATLVTLCVEGSMAAYETGQGGQLWQQKAPRLRRLLGLGGPQHRGLCTLDSGASLGMVDALTGTLLAQSPKGNEYLLFSYSRRTWAYQTLALVYSGKDSVHVLSAAYGHRQVLFGAGSLAWAGEPLWSARDAKFLVATVEGPSIVFENPANPTIKIACPGTWAAQWSDDGKWVFTSDAAGRLHVSKALDGETFFTMAREISAARDEQPKVTQSRDLLVVEDKVSLSQTAVNAFKLSTRDAGPFISGDLDASMPWSGDRSSYLMRSSGQHHVVDAVSASVRLCFDAALLSPTWSPSGAQIAAVDSQHGMLSVLCSRTGTVQHKINSRPSFSSLEGGKQRLKWNPVSTKLAVWSYSGHSRGLALFDLRRDRAVVVAEGAQYKHAGFTEVSWSPDGGAAAIMNGFYDEIECRIEASLITVYSAPAPSPRRSLPQRLANHCSIM